MANRDLSDHDLDSFKETVHRCEEGHELLDVLPDPTHDELVDALSHGCPYAGCWAAIDLVEVNRLEEYIASCTRLREKCDFLIERQPILRAEVEARYAETIAQVERILAL